MAQNKVPLANLGRSIKLVLFEGLECIQGEKNVFQFFFTLLCILQTRFKITVISLRKTWFLQSMMLGTSKNNYNINIIV